MFDWQPGKWLQFAIVGAGLPWLGASWLSTDSLVTDISTRAAAAAGNWAKVQIDGRDATVTGNAVSQEAADAAIKAVQDTYGVRLVNASGVKVVALPPAALMAPTINTLTADGGVPEIKGTWPQDKAKTLDVTVNGTTYSLGKNAELTSDNGNWDLKLAQPLPAGSYDVTAIAGDGEKQSAATPMPGKLVVAAAALAAPTIDTPAIEPGKPVAITGTWPEGQAKTLDVTVNGKTYELGKAPELTSQSGKWTLSLTEPLPPGTYDVKASAGDGTNPAVAAAAPASIAIPAVAQPVAAAPTIDAPKVEAGAPVTLTGTWAAAAAKQLSVTVNGQPYQLGKDADLATDASGKWQLKLKPDLPPGKYAVEVQATDAAGAVQKAEGNFEIAAPAAPPLVAPTIDKVSSDSDHPVITGTWPVATGNSLQVELDGVTHTLGKDADLASDAAGHWTLTPAKPVVNGSYDVVAKVTAADGTSITDTSKNELTVKVAPPPPAPPPAQPYDCEATLARISAVFPIRFEFNHDDLAGPYPTALEQYAALLKDKRCESLKLQVAGHADYLGSESYNLGLSQRRAQTVVDALAKDGIDKARLSSVGFGKTKPLDAAHSDDARAKNRRVEFSIVK